MRDHVGQPVTDFPCPPSPPAAVGDAHARYREACERLAQARAEAAAAEEAVEDAHQGDIAAIVAAADEGREVADPHEGQRAANAERDKARTLLAAAEQLADERGSAVGRAIEQAREAWEASLAERVAAAEGAYSAALEQLRATASELAEGRQLTRWLAAFQGWKLEPGKAPPGVARSMYWPGTASLRAPAVGIPGAEVYAEEVEVSSLLAALGRAVQPLAPPRLAQARRRGRTATIASGETSA